MRVSIVNTVKCKSIGFAHVFILILNLVLELRSCSERASCVSWLRRVP